MDKPRKKKVKTRTYKKYRTAIINGMRKSWAWYHPKYGEELLKRRVEIPKHKKDGELSKVPEVWYRCDLCCELAKELDCDHIDPVVPAGLTYHDLTLDEYEARLDCDVANLQYICTPCHDFKSTLEKDQRKQLKKDKK